MGENSVPATSVNKQLNLTDRYLVTAWSCMLSNKNIKTSHSVVYSSNTSFFLFFSVMVHRANVTAALQHIASTAKGVSINSNFFKSVCKFPHI